MRDFRHFNTSSLLFVYPSFSADFCIGPIHHKLYTLSNSAELANNQPFTDEVIEINSFISI